MPEVSRMIYGVPVIDTDYRHLRFAVTVGVTPALGTRDGRGYVYQGLAPHALLRPTAVAARRRDTGDDELGRPGDRPGRRST
ncbi:hypothetical protein [Nonomuraea sp. B19D2]|uniref:hypothetical protein n=1 Tax=Nonomuraea sp. B19D2 TaxID=3159561 RepID=UPI0032DAE80B